MLVFFPKHVANLHQFSCLPIMKN